MTMPIWASVPATKSKMLTWWEVWFTDRPLALKVPELCSSTRTRMGLPLWSKNTWKLPDPVAVEVTGNPQAALAPSSMKLSVNVKVPTKGLAASAWLTNANVAATTASRIILRLRQMMRRSSRISPPSVVKERSLTLPQRLPARQDGDAALGPTVPARHSFRGPQKSRQRRVRPVPLSHQMTTRVRPQLRHRHDRSTLEPPARDDRDRPRGNTQRPGASVGQP